jgi:hypothetical protein
MEDPAPPPRSLDPSSGHDDPVAELDGEIGPKDWQRFVVVLRGYDRIETDECLGRVAATVASLRQELAQVQHDLADARRADEPAAGQHNGKDESKAPSVVAFDQAGYGMRAERLLRLAEQESAEMRANAARETAAMIEKARADAEHHRHQLEQGLIARAAAQDREAAERETHLQEREKYVADQLSSLSSRIDAVHQAAQRDAEHQRRRAVDEITAIRRAAEDDMARTRQQAGNDLDQVLHARDSALSELQHMVDTLAALIATRRAKGSATGQPASGTPVEAG